MNSEKLVMAVCTQCDVRFYAPNPHPEKKVTRVRVHEEAPLTTVGREIVRFSCLRCQHQQFVEIWYEQ